MGTEQLIKEKLDIILQGIVSQSSITVPVIIQTKDGLKDEDKKNVKNLGGKIKDDLYIINAFSADMPTEGILSLIKSPRIKKIFFDSQMKAV